MHTKTNLRPISLGLALILATAPIVGCSNKSSSSTQSVTSEAASSQEKKQVDVPNVVGMTSEEAHAALWALNLEDEIMSSSGGKAEASANWKVVQQNPEAGKAAQEGDVVKLIVEGQKVSVPDLVGMRCDRAEEALEKLGIESEIKSDSGKTVVVKSNWTVIAQDPAANSEVAAGDVVTLTVSKDAGGADSTKSEDKQDESKPSEDSKQEEAKPEDTHPMAKNSKYAITIDGTRLVDGFDGSLSVAVDFTFTNVSDKDATSMMAAANVIVYQNGVECERDYFADADSDSYMTKVKAGSSVPVTMVFTLQDSSTEVEVEVKEFSFWSDDLLAYGKYAIA